MEVSRTQESYYIMKKTSDIKSPSPVKVKGWICRTDDLWFGIQKTQVDRKKIYVLSELSTGLKVAQFQTMQDAKACINPAVKKNLGNIYELIHKKMESDKKTMDWFRKCITEAYKRDEEINDG